jgi:hypothetical protein
MRIWKLDLLDWILIAILVAGIALATYYLILPSQPVTVTLSLSSNNKIPGTDWRLSDVRAFSKMAAFKNDKIRYELVLRGIGDRGYAITLDNVTGYTVKVTVDMKFYKNIGIYVAAHLLLAISMVASTLALILRIDRLKENPLHPTLIITIASLAIGLTLIYILIDTIT